MAFRQVNQVLCLAALGFALGSPAVAADSCPRPSVWVDVYEGEPLSYEAVLEDLAKSRVIYLGERHSVARHHELQAKIIADLAAKGVPLALGLEQMESPHQPLLDHYNRGQFDFETLAKATEWTKRWRDYPDYRAAIEAAHKAGAPVLALNARADLIRQVARGGGVEKLPPDARKELPTDMHLKDPLYEKLLGMELMVHMAASPERLRPMMEAQIARDEAMSAALVSFLKSKDGQKRTAIVLCGAGHVMYGLGTVERVRRRLPGVRDRIVVFSESGDVQLTPQEKAAARPVRIVHDQLREINRPVADYLQVTGLKP